MNTEKICNPLILRIEVEKLKEPERKLRKHKPEKIKKLARLIKENGIFIPIVIDKEQKIVTGYARYLAAKELGLEKVPAIDASHLTAEQLRAYAIADNKMTETAKWDIDALKFEFKELQELDFDLSLTAFEIPEIDFIIQDSKKNNKNESIETIPDDLNIEKRVNTGDIWQLGKHRLLCGNALDIQNYGLLLKDIRPVMVLTDPPYNLAVKDICGNGKIQHKEFAMASGEMSSEEFAGFLGAIFNNLMQYTIDGSLHYIFMDWRHVLEILTAGKCYSEFKNLCVWNKMVGGQGSFYRSQHELVFVFKNGMGKYINNIQLGKFGRYRTNVWDFKGVHVSNPENKDDLKFHPTCKPVKMLEEVILDASNPDDAVLDCFAGSGSTLLACENTNRVCYAIELEPNYCDVILHRFEQLTGEKVQLVSTLEENKGGQ